MDRLDELQIFVAVVSQGSLAGAARQLRRSPPAITRALASLEQRFSATLIERTTRRLSPTPAGLQLLGQAQALLSGYDQALQASQQTRLSGLLRLTAPVQFGRKHLMPLIMAFTEACPDIQTELLLNDSYQDLIDHNLDMAVRIGHLRDSSLVAVEVGKVQRMLVASPAWLACNAAPANPAGLSDCPLIAGITRSTPTEWRFGVADSLQRVRFTPRIAVNDVEAQLTAARAGKGIARLLSYQVDDDVKQGTLCELLPAFRPPAMPVQLVTQSVRYMPARVRAFWDMARSALPRLNCFNATGSAQAKEC